jgi:hypothetical protein
MDRMRAGLTGLGAVFLLTLAASLAFGPAEKVPDTRDSSEPLAQLGVAPGNDKANGTTSAPVNGLVAPAPAPAEPQVPQPLPETPPGDVPAGIAGLPLAAGDNRVVAI